MSLDLSLAPFKTASASASGFRDSIWPILAGGMAIWLALNWETLVTVWTTGAFIDTDDAMKMVEVRDWLAGQGWFDMTQYRMSAPGGVAMHWSRLFDVPQALLLKFFALFADQTHAERLMRISWAGLNFAAELLVMAKLATRLMGRDSAAFAILLTAFSLVTGSLFIPGAIDHHNTQAVLLITVLWLGIEMLSARSLKYALWAGFLAALSLEISIENLPSYAVMIAALGITYAVRGADYAAQLRAFAISFAASSVLVFVATYAPSTYGQYHYDAFSFVHVGAALIGGVGFYALTLVSPRLPNMQMRFVALAIVGGIAAVLIVVLFPGFLKDPLSAVPELVRKGWLDNVMEAKTLATLLMAEPMDNLPIAIPMLLGTVAMIYAFAKSSGMDRARWAYALGFALIGDIGVFWQVRMAPLTMPIILLGGVYACVAAIKNAEKSTSALAKILPILLIPPICDTVWTIVLPKDGPGSSAAAALSADGAKCFAASAFTPFQALPKGTILSMIDPGSDFLAFTDHNVVTGPFHRDIRGLSLMLQAWRAAPDQALGFIKDAGATYVTYCLAANEFQAISRTPNSLAANLRDGKIPSWLTPVTLEGTPFKVFAVK